MLKNRDTAILYTSGVCNLQCRYCGIDKNPALKDIDKKLAESFDSNYYFEEIKKMFPNRGQLKRIETWGGEPFLFMERIYPLLHKVIKYFPYFSEMFSSTNFSYSTWINQVFNLFEQFAKYPERDFKFCLQLSCDGPEYINDSGRGAGVTKKCLENYNNFINLLPNNLPSNIELSITIKPTLDIENIKLLNTKEKIIEYYKFFENNFLQPAFEKLQQFSNIKIYPPHPNCAVPIPATQEDGIYFANYCKMCREIEKENIFNFYKDITMFSQDFIFEKTYKQGWNFCGTGFNQVGFLPNHMYSACHEGFVHFVEKYKKYATLSQREETGTIRFDKFIGDSEVRFCLNEEQYINYEEQISYNCKKDATAYVATLATEITVLAMAGQISPRFIFPEEALRAAKFYIQHAPCVKDNYNMTGSILLTDYGLIKLFFNGAFEYMTKEIEV